MLIDIRPVSCGMPQDSVTGPLLIVIYVYDLPNASNSAKFTIIADVTALVYDLIMIMTNSLMLMLKNITLVNLILGQ